MIQYATTSAGKINALHVIPAIAPRYGGPSFAIRALCHAQSQQPELHIELATTDADGASGCLDPQEIPTAFATHVFPRSWSERWKYSYQLGHWFKEHVRRFHVIHIHALWSYTSFAAAQAARRARLPYIIRPAGMLSTYSLSHRSISKRMYWCLAEKRTVFEAAAFHATSAAEAEDIRRICPKASVTVVPNGVEDEAWSVPRRPNALRERLGIKQHDGPLLLFLSRLHPKKGITDLLLPAFARLPNDVRLVIGGGIDSHAPEYARQVEDEIRKRRLTERVTLLGSVSPADRWQMFDGCDAFVLPSHSENFGIVVAEAMARACPVVISDAVQSCDHVRRAGAGLVVPTDVDHLAAALNDIVSDAAARRRMGEAGRQYAAETFSWSQIADQVRKLYDTVLSTTMTLSN